MDENSKDEFLVKSGRWRTRDAGKIEMLDAHTLQETRPKESNVESNLCVKPRVNDVSDVSMPSFPIIESARLRLRPPKASDASDIQWLAAHPDVALPTGSIPHPYPNEANRWLLRQEQLAQRGSVETFAIVLREQQQFTGVIDLRRTEFAHAYEVGFWVGRPSGDKAFAAKP